MLMTFRLLAHTCLRFYWLDTVNIWQVFCAFDLMISVQLLSNRHPPPHKSAPLTTPKASVSKKLRSDGHKEQAYRQLQEATGTITDLIHFQQSSHSLSPRRTFSKLIRWKATKLSKDLVICLVKLARELSLTWFMHWTDFHIAVIASIHSGRVKHLW